MTHELELIEAMKVFVRKNDVTLGPFEEQEVLDKVGSGEFSEDDQAMTEGLDTWTPLKSIIVKEPAMSPFSARVEAYVRVAAGAAKSVRLMYSECPIVTGIVALLSGCVLMILAQWPWLIYGPFFLAAMIASIILFRHQRVVSGILILMFTIALPLTIWGKVFHNLPGIVSDKVAVENAVSAPAPTTAVQPAPVRPALAPIAKADAPAKPIDGLVPPAGVVETATPPPKLDLTLNSSSANGQGSTVAVNDSVPGLVALGPVSTNAAPKSSVTNAASPVQRADPVAAPTPHPARAATQAAIARYPALGQRNSSFNLLFLDLLDQRKKEDPASLAQPDWPLQLADETALKLGVRPVDSEPRVVMQNTEPAATPESKGNPFMDGYTNPLSKGAYNERRGPSRYWPWYWYNGYRYYSP